VKIALDTNVLIYLEAIATDPRGKIISDLLERIPAQHVLIPAQVLGEYFHVLIRKHGYSPSEAKANLQILLDTYDTIPTSSDMVASAADLVTVQKRSFWDAVILSSAASAGCRMLLSEDGESGLTWAGVTLVDPFVTPRDPLLEMLLASLSGQ